MPLCTLPQGISFSPSRGVPGVPPIGTRGVEGAIGGRPATGARRARIGAGDAGGLGGGAASGTARYGGRACYRKRGAARTRSARRRRGPRGSPWVGHPIVAGLTGVRIACAAARRRWMRRPSTRLRVRSRPTGRRVLLCARGFREESARSRDEGCRVVRSHGFGQQRLGERHGVASALTRQPSGQSRPTRQFPRGERLRRSASQAECRGFEPRRPLQAFACSRFLRRECSPTDRKERACSSWPCPAWTSECGLPRTSAHLLKSGLGSLRLGGSRIKTQGSARAPRRVRRPPRRFQHAPCPARWAGTQGLPAMASSRASSRSSRMRSSAPQKELHEGWRQTEPSQRGSCQATRAVGWNVMLCPHSPRPSRSASRRSCRPRERSPGAAARARASAPPSRGGAPSALTPLCR